MSDLLLTRQERDRFVLYLLRDAESGELIAEQMEKLGVPAVLLLAKKTRAESAACRIVAQKLRSMEFQSVEAPEGHAP